MIRQIAAGALLLISSSAVHADMQAFDTGNDLYQYCQQPHASYAFGLCAGLVTGYFEGVQLIYDCPIESQRIAREQLVDIVLKHLRQHPEDRHKSAEILAGGAFVVAFRCAPRPIKFESN